MFGLKIVKAEELSFLQMKLDSVNMELSKKDALIIELQSTIAGLKNEIETLKNFSKEEEPILLIDVAETPLKEAKPVKRTRKTVSKTTTSKPRQKIVHKEEIL